MMDYQAVISKQLASLDLLVIKPWSSPFARVLFLINIKRRVVAVSFIDSGMIFNKAQVNSINYFCSH